MNGFFSKDQVSKLKNPILLLSLVSLICSVLGSLSTFVYYTVDYEYYTLRLAFRFPEFLSLILFLIRLAPPVLLFLYFFKFQNHPKAQMFLVILLGSVAVSAILPMILYATFLEFSYDLSTILFNISLAAVFGLAIYSELKDYKKRLFFIIAAATGIAVDFFSLLRSLQVFTHYIEWEYYFYIFTMIMSYAGTATLFVALLLYALKLEKPASVAAAPVQPNYAPAYNPTPAYNPAVKTQQPATPANEDPEQALKLLKEIFELGLITAEEYQEQRAEIINKL